MTELRIDLFGPPAVAAGDQRLQHSSRKAMALLAYLAMRAGEQVTRAHLADLLWGESAEEQARTNLRQALSLLRKLFREAGHDPLMVPFDQVLLQPEGIEIEARALLRDEAGTDVERLAAGPAFLEGFSVPAAGFESWMTAQRLAVEARLCDTLEQAAEAARQAGDAAGASRRLALVLQRDPLRETAQRAQMAALAALGRSDAALAQYETCRELLRATLQTEPQAETQALARQIRGSRRRPQDRAALEADGDGPAVFDRYPAAAPACLYHRPARSHRPDLISRIAFPDAEAALHGALELQRQLAEAAALEIAVLPDLGRADEEAQAAALLALAQPGDIIVVPEIYRLFASWSPFSFEQAPGPGAEAAEGPIYRLLSEMPRHRLQVAPATTQPEARLDDALSLVVLPFRDHSPQAPDLALGDVLAEEITGRVARFRGLTVAAPSAAQTCRALHLTAERIRERLGVNYLADGSLRLQDDKLHVSLSLADLRTGTLIYSDRFEGSLARLFDLQGRLVDRIATAIVRKAEGAEVARAQRAPTADMAAYQWYLRGLAAHRRAGISPENARHAFAHFTEAIGLDPDFAKALAWRICSVSWYAPEYFVSPGLQEIHRALAIDEYDAEVQRIAGALHLYRGDYEDGIAHMERAVALNPSDAYLLATSAVYWAYSGEPENGLKHIERAMQLDPFLPVWCVEDHGVVLYSMEDFEGAAQSLQRLACPTPRALGYLAAARSALGDEAGAEKAVARIRHIARRYSVDEFMTTNYFRRPADKAALRARLHQAGLP